MLSCFVNGVVVLSYMMCGVVFCVFLDERRFNFHRNMCRLRCLPPRHHPSFGAQTFSSVPATLDTDTRMSCVMRPMSSCRRMKNSTELYLRSVSIELLHERSACHRSTSHGCKGGGDRHKVCQKEKWDR